MGKCEVSSAAYAYTKVARTHLILIQSQYWIDVIPLNGFPFPISIAYIQTEGVHECENLFRIFIRKIV